MTTICGARGWTCATRHDWAHRGCEVPGAQRETNRRAGTLAPGPAAVATDSRAGVPAMWSLATLQR